MSSFKGFSEEDIKRVNTVALHNRPVKQIDESIISNKRVLLKINKGQKNAIIKSLATSNKRLGSNEETYDVPEEAKLSRPKTPSVTTLSSEENNSTTDKNLQEEVESPEKVPALNAKFTTTGNLPVTKLSSDNSTEQSTEEDPKQPLEQQDPKGQKYQMGINNEKETAQEDEKPDKVSLEETKRKRTTDLEALQTRQKLIEEQNRKRKEMLAKALADRTKRTREETERLNEIKREFKKLDAMLSEDVNILRKQIEIASVDYMEAQKKYYKIEKEFLDAKLVLHQKLERKELLTEHLYAIIEKNEERKAQKLNELLDKLNVCANESQNRSSPPENKDEKS